MSNRPEDLTFSDAKLRLNIFRDGTVTKAEIAFRDPDTREWDLLADGVSRRRPGEARDQELGDDLAIARAFANASNLYYKRAQGGGYGLVDELNAALRGLVDVLRAT